MTSVSPGFDVDRSISDRARSIDVSGIRRVFELGAKLKDPINLSIGQPDFPVPDAMKQAAIEAIRSDRNGYTLTQGTAELYEAVRNHLSDDVGWTVGTSAHDSLGCLVTSGTSGALLLAAMVLLNPGDEAVIPDPYFVMYPQLGPLTGGRMIPCDTYPDFRLTAERLEPLLTPRTKFVLVNSPGNPSGVVLSSGELRELVDLCDRRGVLLISDEIYDQFTFEDSLEGGRCPSPARFSDRVLLIRGFGKTYGCTGWRLGYTAGPKRIIQEMAKLQQYTFVCAPAPLQVGVTCAFDVDMSSIVAGYQKRRDMVLSLLGPHTQLATPGGAFYAFVGLPQRMLDSGETATTLVERAIENSVLVIPGKVFSRRDTHFRLSFATAEPSLRRGLEILARLLAA